MTAFIIVLGLFLLAFVGLSIGLLFNRKGPGSGCGHQPEGHDCSCKTDDGQPFQRKPDCPDLLNNRKST